MKFKYFFSLIVLLIAGHIGVSLLGWYGASDTADFPLHVLGGIALATLWLWVLNKTQSLRTMDPWLLIVSTLGFTALGSILWEMNEYYTYTLFPNFGTELRNYVVSVSDVLLDHMAMLLGGLFTAVFYLMRVNYFKKTRKDTKKKSKL